MDQKLNQQMIDAEYVEKMCYEFSRLIYDISEEHNRARAALEKRCLELEARCSEYEMQLLAPSEATLPSMRLNLKIRVRRLLSATKHNLKKLLAVIARPLFHICRGFATRLGIKDRLKKTSIFKKLYLKGTIDNLRDGVDHQ